MTYRKKSDANQQAIIDELRQYPGISVRSIHRHGDGIPDLLVGFRRRTYLYEIKDEGGELNENERKFFRTWSGHVTIARCVEDILDDIGYFDGKE